MDLFITSENGNLVQNGDVIKPPLFRPGAIAPTVTDPALEEQYQDDAAASLSRFKQTSELDMDAINPILANLSDEAKRKIIEAT